MRQKIVLVKQLAEDVIGGDPEHSSCGPMTFRGGREDPDRS